jgi:sugar lactone lactonase YvrE
LRYFSARLQPFLIHLEKTMKTAKISALLFASVLILSGMTAAMEGPPPILNPTVHVSPSSVYSLEVNPSDLHGRGSADYRFTKNGETVWARQLPFTLWEVEVANSGYVAGYAYCEGWRGFFRKGYRSGEGTFIVVILSPQGKVVAKDSYRREGSRFRDTPPNPLAKGIIIDESSNRTVVRIADPDINHGVEQWWIYDLHRGKRIKTLEPRSRMGFGEQRLSILKAKAVPSTPLILVHWWKYDESRLGGVFTLVDGEGKPVWELKLDDDYNFPADEKQEDEVREMIWKRGGILSVGTNGVFALHLVKDRLKVDFAVTKEVNGGWQVSKVGQSPYEWRQPAKSAPSTPLQPLRKLGTTTLSFAGPTEKPAIRDLEGFDFDPTGKICALRASRESPPCLLSLSQDGKILKELSLPVDRMPERVKFSCPANVGEERFVVSVSDESIGGLAQWFLADFKEGAVKKITNAVCPCVDAVAGFPDGRFVALTSRHSKYTITDGLFLFDPAGNLIWSKEQDGYSGKPDDLLSPEDITRYGTNEIAVLDNIRHTIQVFSTQGALVRTLDLEKVWGREPNYPTDIAADCDGGFIVYDFNAKQTLLRLDAMGAIRSAAVPLLANSRPFRVADGIQRSPQGALWASDGDSLFRLSTNAIVDLTLGEPSIPSILSSPGCVEIGPGDRVYVADRRSHVVHVFDSTGQRLGCCIPSPADLTETSSVRQIALSPAGHVYLKLDMSEEGYLHFASDLNRVGWMKLDADSVSQEWHFQPTNELCWVVGYNDVFLVKHLRKIVQKISRRADGHWLEYPDAAAVAEDGSIAVLAFGQGARSVSIYGATGEARSTFSAPLERFESSIAFDGRLVYLRRESDVLCFGADGAELGAFTLGPDPETHNWMGPFLAAKGRELWFISTTGLTIHRYAAPNE